MANDDNVRIWAGTATYANTATANKVEIDSAELSFDMSKDIRTRPILVSIASRQSGQGPITKIMDRGKVTETIAIKGYLISETGDGRWAKFVRLRNIARGGLSGKQNTVNISFGLTEDSATAFLVSNAGDGSSKPNTPYPGMIIKSVKMTKSGSKGATGETYYEVSVTGILGYEKT